MKTLFVILFFPQHLYNISIKRVLYLFFLRKLLGKWKNNFFKVSNKTNYIWGKKLLKTLA